MQKNTNKFLQVSVIITVLNEEQKIGVLLHSLAGQTQLPTEVIIVDGRSSDGTWQLLQKAVETFPTKLIVKQKTGNRSVGRNYAISLATQEVIACTDAGCVPQPDWLAELYAVHQTSQSDVVAGYYQGISTSSFEEAVVPYALVMPNSVNPQKFLPATRSMLFRKDVWEKIGGFDETLSDNEDYAFAKKIEAQGFSISFAQKAVVSWHPRSTLNQFYTMIFRFARGDIFAGIVRPKVLLIFARYVFIGLCTLASLSAVGTIPFRFLLFLLLIYSSWAIFKNYKNVKNGWYWLPILQIVSDLAVMHGSVAGAVQKITR
jgi:glycosyltransferase involved in cell wall biosynthesis